MSNLDSMNTAHSIDLPFEFMAQAVPRQMWGMGDTSLTSIQHLFAHEKY